MLGLETEGRAIAVGLAGFQGVGAGHKISAIELEPRFGGIDGHDDTAEVTSGDRGGDVVWFVGDTIQQHKIVIVTFSKFDLLIGGIVYAAADSGRLCKVKRRAGYRFDLTGGNQRRIDRRVMVGVKLEEMVIDRSASLPVQVEVRVIGEVEHRGLVGRCAIGNPKSVAVEYIGYRDLEVSRIAFLSIFGKVGQPEGGGVQLPCVPDDGVKTFLPAMERIGTVILIQRIFLSVELEFRMPDPVAIATDDGAEIGVRLVEIFSDAVIAQDDVGRVAVLVGNDKAYDPGAVIGDGGRQIAVMQEVESRWGGRPRCPGRSRGWAAGWQLW